MKIYNITIKREIVDLTEEDCDEEEKEQIQQNSVDTVGEDICEIDGNQSRDERIDQRKVSEEQTGNISAKE